MSYTDELQAIYDEWEARTLRQGEKAGRRKFLSRLYEAGVVRERGGCRHRNYLK